jgi:hypothetical protein
MSPYGQWQPAQFKRYISSVGTSTGTSRILTDRGEAFIKPLGNKQGPHVLACEWVATRLAEWFGLETFDYALLVVNAEDEIPLFGGRHASAGRAFVTRATAGSPWDGSSAQLASLKNREDVGTLVVFDTWTLNCDRHPPDTNARRPNLDNVYVSTAQGAGHRRLIAMDHTHCFSCGGDLSPSLASISKIKDERLYGLFPEFVPFVSRTSVKKSVATLASVTSEVVEPFVTAIPIEWQVSPEARAALVDLIVQRADFVAGKIEAHLAPTCWPSDSGQPQE